MLLVEYFQKESRSKVIVLKHDDPYDILQVSFRGITLLCEVHNLIRQYDFQLLSSNVFNNKYISSGSNILGVLTILSKYLAIEYIQWKVLKEEKDSVCQIFDDQNKVPNGTFIANFMKNRFLAMMHENRSGEKYLSDYHK
jgi:hypothetical protein